MNKYIKVLEANSSPAKHSSGRGLLGPSQGEFLARELNSIQGSVNKKKEKEDKYKRIWIYLAGFGLGLAIGGLIFILFFKLLSLFK